MKSELLNKICFIIVILLLTLRAHSQTTKSLWVGETFTCDATSAVMGITANVSWSCTGGYINLSGAGFYRNVTATQYWSGTASVTCSWQYKLYSGGSYTRASRTWYFTCNSNPLYMYPEEMTLALGETGYVGAGLTYTNSYSSYASIYFTSSNSTIASVDTYTGEVYAKSPGTTYINARCVLSGNTPYCKVTVKNVQPTSATVSSPIYATCDQPKTLSVDVYPSNATVSSKNWYIASGGEYVTLTTSGTLTGKSPGTAYVYCVVNGSVTSNEARVEVSEPSFTKSSTAPTDNATEQSVFVTPSVTYSLALYNGDNFQNISLKNKDTGANVAGTATISGKTVTFSPSAVLQPQTNYMLTIPANAVKNKWGTHYGSAVTVNFKTGNREKLTLTSSLAAGFVAAGTTVSLTASKSDAKIYYTTDGTTPTAKSSLYTGPITITRDMKLRAVAMGDGYENSDVLACDYIISNVEVVEMFPVDDAPLYLYKDVNPFVAYSNKMEAGENLDGIMLKKTDGEAVAGEVLMGDSAVYFVPDEPLELGCSYTVTIPSGAVRTWQGEQCKATSWTFTTGNFATAVGMGPELAAAVKTDGSLLTWGHRLSTDNSATGEYSYVVQDVPEAFIDKDVREVSCGFMHTAVIKTDGTLWTWGRQYCGELGDGSTAGKTSPVKILDDASHVSAGGQTTAVVKNDGTLWVWGRNDFGQVGDSTVTVRLQPVKVMDDIAQAACGWCTTYAVKTDGTLWAWGRNDQHQMGDGGTIGTLRPRQVMGNVAQVMASPTEGQWTAAVKTDGSLWTWGKEMPTPQKILDEVSSAAVGQDYIVAVKTDGTLWAWGGNNFGQMGNGTTNKVASPTKIMDKAVSVASGGETTIILRQDGSVWTCGSNASNLLGTQTALAYSTKPIKIVEGRSSTILTAMTTIRKNVQIDVDGQTVLTALPSPLHADYGELRWTSADEGIATISERGVVTGVAVGQTMVTAEMTPANGRTMSLQYVVKVGGAELTGDVNGDGAVNGGDVMAVYDTMAGGTANEGRSDVNGDGAVNGGDVMSVYDIMAGGQGSARTFKSKQRKAKNVKP